MPATPIPSQRPTSRSARSARSSPAAAARRTSSTASRPPARGVGARGAQEGGLADLGLEAATRAAAAGAAVGVHGDMPDLPRVPVRATQGPAVQDHPATDPHLAVEEDEVVHADARAPLVLGEGTEVGVVAHVHRHRLVEGRRDELSERLVPPAEVGRDAHEAVVASHHADDRDADADQPLHRGRHEQRLAEALDFGHDVRGGHRSPQAVDANLAAHLTAEPDDRDRQRVDRDLDGERDRSVLRQPDLGRRAPASRRAARGALHDQSPLGELGDERGDGAPAELRPLGEVRARQGAGQVQVPQDHAQVVGPELLTAAAVAEVDLEGTRAMAGGGQSGPSKIVLACYKTN